MTESERLVPPSTMEVYRAIRSQIEHEDTQVNQRVNWLLISHSFLFTAFAITLTSRSRVPDSTFSTFPLLVLIPCVGLFSTLLIGVSIAAGILAMRELHRAFADRAVELAAEGLLLLRGSRGVRGLGLVTPVLLPLLFTSVWLFLLIRAAHETIGAR